MNSKHVANKTLVTLSIAITLIAIGCGSDRPNLVIISLDTVRADHLGTYGYHRGTSPRLDALASSGVVFERAYTIAPNTGPSHSTMLTGLPPHLHGARTNGTSVNADVTTLAEILRDSGYSTGAFVSGAPMRSEISGLDRGFEHYEDEFPAARRSAESVMALAKGWLARRLANPYFLFIHLYDAHGPYLPSSRYAALFPAGGASGRVGTIPDYQKVGDRQGRVDLRLENYIARYDAVLRYLDDQLASLLAEIDLRNTLVIVTSDHGETLGERHWNLDHGAQLFDEQLRIPLILHGPGLEPMRSAAQVDTLDFVPTILEYLELPDDPGVAGHGRSLLPLISKQLSIPDRPLFASGRSISQRHRDRGYELNSKFRTLSVRSDGWKLIRYPGMHGRITELYDLEADPGEIENLASQKPEIRDRYLELIERERSAAIERIEDPILSPDQKRKLKALGYIEP